MARLDRHGLHDAVVAATHATPDPEGLSDLVANVGRINLAASGAEVKDAIERLRELPGYRWIAINSADLFAASPLTLGSKVGIIDAGGKVLKAADLPRAR
jgi:hypothetical protein